MNTFQHSTLDGAESRLLPPSPPTWQEHLRRLPRRELARLVGPAAAALVLLVAVHFAGVWLSSQVALLTVSEARAVRNARVMALYGSLYLETGQPAFMITYDQAQSQLAGTRQVGQAFRADPLDEDAALQGMRKAGNTEAESRQLLRLMRVLRHSPRMALALDHWATTTALVTELEQLMAEIRQWHMEEDARPSIQSFQATHARREAFGLRLGQLSSRIDEEARSFTEDFQDAVADVRQVEHVAFALIGLLLLAGSIAAALRPLATIHQARLELHDANERYAMATQAVNDGVWDWDIEHDKLAWTPRLRELLGYVGDEEFGQLSTLQAIIHPEDAESTFHRIRGHLKGESPRLDLQARLRCVDGQYRWYRIRGMAHRAEDGRATRMIGTLTDEHEHVLMEMAQVTAQRERQKAATELELALDAAHVALWAFDPRTGVILHHRRWDNLLGRKVMPAHETEWQALIHPADRERHNDLLKAHLEGRSPRFDFEYRMRHASGHWIWVRCRGRVTRRDADRRPLEYAGAVMNASHEVAARLAQRAQYEFVQAMIEGIDTGILLSSVNRIEYANAALCRMLGYTKEYMVGQSVLHFIASPEAARDVEAARHRALGGAEMRARILDLRNSQGGIVRVFSATTHVRWNDVSHFITTVTPLEDLAVFETRMRSVQARFERVLLDELESQQAHIARELHDSLGSVLAGLSLLLAGTQKLAAAGQPVVDTLERCQEQVREAAETTRALARGIMPVASDEGALHHALERFVHDAEMLMGVRVDLDIQCDLDSVLPSAANHIYRVIQEAVNNAVRHGQAHHLVIAARDSERAWTFTIQDDGTGFADLGIPENEPAGAQEGVGLRSMHARADVMGGTLAIRPAPNGGVEVVLRVPRPTPSLFQQRGTPDESVKAREH